MASPISDLMTAGAALEIDLLMAVPSSSDKSSWIFPRWRGYRSVFSVADVQSQDGQGSLLFSTQGQFLASSGIWIVAAAAITYQGQVIAIAPFAQPVVCTSITPLPVKVTGMMNAVL